MAVGIETGDAREIVALDGAGVEEKGRFEEDGCFFLGSAIGELFEQTLGGEMVGGTTGQVDGKT